MKKESKIHSFSPEKAIIQAIVIGAMQYGIPPGKAGEYLQDLAEFLTPVPEHERASILHELTDSEKLSSPFNNRAKWSIQRLGLNPIRVVQFNIDLVRAVDNIPTELQTEAINPELLINIAGHLKGKV